LYMREKFCEKILLFVNANQKKYDSIFRVSRKNKFMLSCVRVQVDFKKYVSLKLKNRIRISGFFSTGVFIEKHLVFCKPGKVQEPV
jgi:hypothetical protein